jgi:thermostable 8-oxoguanine DNA glycosylase
MLVLGFSRSQLAILDSHILEYLIHFKVIARISENLPAKTYLNIEHKMKEWAYREIPDIPLDHLDWVLWDIASGTACR